MSRILRRPMFRGGPVDSRGTGITSGLDKPKRGLVNEPGGYAGEKSGMDFLKSALNKYVLGERFTNPNYVSPMKFQSGTGFGFMSPENQAPGLTQIGEGVRSRNPRMGELGIDELADIVKYSGGQEAEMKKSDLEMGEGDIDESETLSSDFYEKLIGQKVDDTPYEGGKAGSDTAPKIKTNLLSDDTILNKQNTANEELTLEEIRDTLGYKKAFRRDLGDTFGRGAAAFIGAESLTEGAKKFFELENQSGPGRAEKIETAAATFMLKDKAQTKRDKANVALMKSKIDYQIEAGEDISLPKALLAANKSGMLNNKELSVGIQSATSPTTGKNYNFKKVVTLEEFKNIKDAKPGDTFVVKTTVKDSTTGTEKILKSIIEIDLDGTPQRIYNIA